MNTTTCPLGGACGGTGWLWSPGRGYPEPEPPEWYPCHCNPSADGEPNKLLDYEAMFKARMRGWALAVQYDNELAELQRLWRMFQGALKDGDQLGALSFGANDVAFQMLCDAFDCLAERQATKSKATLPEPF